MDEADAGGHGGVDIRKPHRLPLEEQLPLVRLIDAGEDFHQGGFASPVLPDEREDFPRIDVERDGIKGDDAREAFARPAHFKEGRGHNPRLSSPTPESSSKKCGFRKGNRLKMAA